MPPIKALATMETGKGDLTARAPSPPAQGVADWLAALDNLSRCQMSDFDVDPGFRAGSPFRPCHWQVAACLPPRSTDYFELAAWRTRATRHPDGRVLQPATAGGQGREP